LNLKEITVHYDNNLQVFIKIIDGKDEKRRWITGEMD